MNYRYHIKYGLRSDDRARFAFIVCDPNMADLRAQTIVDAFYDNLVEQGVIFDNNIDYYVEQVRDELAEKKTKWSEEDIWSEAYLRYYAHRSLATWYQVEEAY